MNVLDQAWLAICDELHSAPDAPVDLVVSKARMMMSLLARERERNAALVAACERLVAAISYVGAELDFPGELTEARAALALATGETHA